MKGLSERDYAQRIGLSRGAVQKARGAGRLVTGATVTVRYGKPFELQSHDRTQLRSRWRA